MKEKFPISSVISYCTNDYRYLAKCIEEVKKFSSQVVVVTCDHFFSGEPEDEKLLLQTYAEFPEIEFIEFAHIKDHLYSKYINRSPDDRDWFDFWHSTTRYIPFFFVKNSCDYILFLDSDEIVEGDLFLEWLNTEEYRTYDALRWLQYYYFREPVFVASDFQIGGLMAKKGSLTPSILLNTDDRCGIFHSVEGEKREGVSYKGRPMIHHYSWVKTKEECLLKARNWGHAWEKDWKSLIEEEFSRDFLGKDFEGRKYEKIPEAYFNPLEVKIDRSEQQQKLFPNVRKVDEKEIQKRHLSFEFQIPFQS